MLTSDVKEAPASRAPRIKSGGKRSRERRMPYVLLDRRAAKARLKGRASLDALSRLAMTKRPPFEASDRARLGSCRQRRNGQSGTRAITDMSMSRTRALVTIPQEENTHDSACLEFSRQFRRQPRRGRFHDGNWSVRSGLRRRPA